MVHNILYILYIKIHIIFLNIAKQFALITALVKSIKYLINHTSNLIFQLKKLIITLLLLQ